jgi:hypothetical protein
VPISCFTHPLVVYWRTSIVKSGNRHIVSVVENSGHEQISSLVRGLYAHKVFCLDVFHFRSHIRSAVWKATLSVPSLFSCLLVSRHCLARLKKLLPSCVVHITTSGEHAYTFPCCIHERASLVKCTAGPEKFLFATTEANRFLFQLETNFCRRLIT